MATWLFTKGKFASAQESSDARLASQDDDGGSSSRPREPPLVGIAAGLFAISFAGAAVYGVRAGRKAQLKEAAEAAQAAVKSSTNGGVSPLHRAPIPQPTATPRPPTVPSSSSKGLDWGKSGTSMPSVLSRRGASSSPSGSTTTPPPPSQQPLQESPALTAIKAFSIATALVAVGAAVSLEVGRRVWGIEDMYDLTDRLHAGIPKSFNKIESIGDFLREKFAGIVPKPPQDQVDSLREPTSTPPSSLASRNDTTQSVDELWDAMTQVETIRGKLELLEGHLQREKVLQDRQREEYREMRRHRAE